MEFVCAHIITRVTKCVSMFSNTADNIAFWGYRAIFRNSVGNKQLKYMYVVTKDREEQDPIDWGSA